MTSQFDYVAAGWVLLLFGMTVSVLGSVALVGWVSGLPRREGWSSVALGVGNVLWGVALVRRLPGNEPSALLQWAGTLCLAAGACVLLIPRRPRRVIK